MTFTSLNDYFNLLSKGGEYSESLYVYNFIWKNLNEILYQITATYVESTLKFVHKMLNKRDTLKIINLSLIPKSKTMTCHSYNLKEKQSYETWNEIQYILTQWWLDCCTKTKWNRATNVHPLCFPQATRQGEEDNQVTPI